MEILGEIILIEDADFNVKNNKYAIIKKIFKYEPSKRITIKSFINILAKMDNISNWELFKDVHFKLMSFTDDSNQLSLLKKLIKIKKTKIFNYSKICYFKKIYKFCPFCSAKNYGGIDEEYIICGYGKRGYNFIGCGNDWCFICNKKLCKNWIYDQLYNLSNRYHNNKCCLNHSKLTNTNYDEYCKCSNHYVKR